MKNILSLLLILVGAFAVGPPAKHWLEGVLAGESVPQKILETRWETQNLGNLTFDAPWQLWNGSAKLGLPTESTNGLLSSETLKREGDGLSILAMRATYFVDRQSNLGAAIAGAERSLRESKGVKSARFSYNNTAVGGFPAADLDAMVTNLKGETHRFRGLLVARKESLYQVIVSYRADQPNGEIAWRRLRGSALVDGRP